MEAIMLKTILKEIIKKKGEKKRESAEFKYNLHE